MRIEDAILGRKRKIPGQSGPLDVACGKLARLHSSLLTSRAIKYIDRSTLDRLYALVEGVQEEVNELLGVRAVRAKERWQERLLKIQEEL